LTASDTTIPIVPASGAARPAIESPRQAERPRIEDERAPNLVTFRLMIPQTKGPRKNDPTAPHETDRMETIVAGLK